MQALYRKYRPKTFDEISGQNTITETLKNQVINKDIAHAYLFLGTRGTGKTSAAKIMSRAVNCEDPIEGNPCNQCSTCLGILDERILDVIEMDAASNNSVDDIRELKDKAAYPPSLTKRKVYIIDEVHMLSKGAFNALLKILEEPPKHVLFILATTEPQKIPATIISRTQRFQFNRLKVEELIEEMARILTKENIDYDKEALLLIANHSDGSMRDALSILDQTLNLIEEKLCSQTVKDVLGLTDHEVLERIVDGILAKEPHLLLDQIETVYRRGKNMSRFLESIMEQYRDMLILKSTSSCPNHISLEEARVMEEQAGQFSYEELFSGIDIINKSIHDLKYAQDAKLICEVTILKLLQRESCVQNVLDGRSIKKRNEFTKDIPTKKTLEASSSDISSEDTIQNSLEEKSKEVVLNNSQADAIISKETNATSLEINEVWDKLLLKIRSLRPSTFALLREARLVSFEGEQLVIGFKEGFDFHKLAVENTVNKNIIIEAAESIKGKVSDFRTVTLAEEDPNIQRLKEIFGEDIVEVIDE